MLDITVENQSEGRVRVTSKGRLDTQTYAHCEQQRLGPLRHRPRVCWYLTWPNSIT